MTGIIRHGATDDYHAWLAAHPGKGPADYQAALEAATTAQEAELCLGCQLPENHCCCGTF